MLKRVVLPLLLLLVALVAGGCSLFGLGAPGAPGLDVAGSIEQMAAAVAAKNDELLAEHLAPAIVAQLLSQEDEVAPATLMTFDGRTEIMEQLRELWTDMVIEHVEVDPSDIRVWGKTAEAEGSFTIEFRRTGQALIECSGVGRLSLTRDGGVWSVTEATVYDSSCVNGDAVDSGGDDDRTLELSALANGSGYTVVPGSSGAGRSNVTYGSSSGSASGSSGLSSGVTNGASGSVSSNANGAQISTLQAGTANATAVYTYRGSQSGPTLVFIGCIHGNEKSGHLTLKEAVADGIRIDKGKLIVIPALNQVACDQNRRTASGTSLGGKDFNRMFPVGKAPTTSLAKELWALLERESNLAFVVDFHDGFINSLGNTLLHTKQAKASQVAKKTRDALNRIRPSGAKGPKWRAFSEPISGSLVRKVGRDLKVPGMIAELSGRNPGDPLSLRKKYAQTIITTVAKEFGMTVAL